MDDDKTEPQLRQYEVPGAEVAADRQQGVNCVDPGNPQLPMMRKNALKGQNKNFRACGGPPAGGARIFESN